MSEHTGKSVLITNLMITGYSGSELHVVDMARQFRNHGWDVTCFTLIACEPTRSLLEKIGVRIVEFPNTDALNDHYDLLFAQHHFISDFIATQDITFDRIAVSILGPQSFHEHVPELAIDANLILYVSDECHEARKPEAPEGVPHLIFPNYGHEDFFNLPPRTLPDVPQHIAVISNHPPQEIQELSERTDLPFTIDSIGWDGYARLADTELLSRYDCVVAIGRTVLDCFAASIPLYCYDHFGGPGYIHPDEADHHAYYNFSGRSLPRRLTADKLIDDIVTGYADATTALPQLRQYARTHHNLADNFSHFLSALDDTPVRPQQRHTSPALRSKYRYSCEFLRDQLCGTIGMAEVYWGENFGDISEERKKRIAYRFSTLITLNLDDLDIPESHRIVRFDPHISRCSTSVITPHWQAVNAHSSAHNTDTFLSCAPAYLPEIEAEKRRIQFASHLDDALAIDIALEEILNAHKDSPQPEDIPSLGERAKKILRRIRGA